MLQSHEKARVSIKDWKRCDKCVDAPTGAHLHGTLADNNHHEYKAGEEIVSADIIHDRVSEVETAHTIFVLA